MYYTVYRVTNLINGKYYIGMHRTMNLADTYMGSGDAIRKAIKKYGRRNFMKEILYVFDDEDKMVNKERELIVISENTYNLTRKGKGGTSNTGSKPGRKHTEESKEKMRRSAMGIHRGDRNGNWRRNFSEETRDKMAHNNSKTWEITYPNGEIQIINNLRKFCFANNLDPASMQDVAKGQRRQHKGFTVKSVEVCHSA